VFEVALFSAAFLMMYVREGQSAAGGDDREGDARVGVRGEGPEEESGHTDGGHRGTPPGHGATFTTGSHVTQGQAGDGGEHPGPGVGHANRHEKSTDQNGDHSGRDQRCSDSSVSAAIECRHPEDQRGSRDHVDHTLFAEEVADFSGEIRIEVVLVALLGNFFVRVVQLLTSVVGQNLAPDGRRQAENEGEGRETEKDRPSSESGKHPHHHVQDGGEDQPEARVHLGVADECHAEQQQRGDSGANRRGA